MKRILLIVAISAFALVGVCTVLVVATSTVTEPSTNTDLPVETTPTSGQESTARAEPTSTLLPEPSPTLEPTVTPRPTSTVEPAPTPTPRPVVSLTASELYALRETNSERYDFEYKGRSILIRGIICEIESDTIQLSANDLFGCGFDSVALNDLPLTTLLSPSTGDMITALCIVGEYIFGTIQLNACEVPDQTLLAAFATATPTATPIPVPGESRNVPIPFGETGTINNGPTDHWEVTVVSVDPDANDVIQAENRFNDPPEEGNQFFLIRVRIKYVGEGSEEFSAGSRLKAVGNEGIVYETFRNRCGIFPDEFPSGSEVFSGGTLEGNECWQIRMADVNSLTLFVDAGPFSEGGRVWFALRP